jgi:hypothetical protein
MVELSKGVAMAAIMGAHGQAPWAVQPGPQQGQRSVADRNLRALIDKSLPVLRWHLPQAQDLAGRMAG